MEQKSSINPAILQPMLESAANAAEKGQSQFFTPLAFARNLATALPPRCRPAIVDLNCGAGHLLQASALPDTELLLGNDIDPGSSKIEGLVNPRHISRLTRDLTVLYPLLKEINFSADLFVLNPPWRLWWYRERLAALAHSKLPAVREAFANLEETAPRKGTAAGTIDSTIATLLIALDLCTQVGEGLLIANNATLERLIFGYGGRVPTPPHAAIARHVWAHLVIPGNPMSGSATCNWNGRTDFHTGVIYFAADHRAGPQKYRWTNPVKGPLPDRACLLGAELRQRASARQFIHDEWLAVKDKLAELDGQTPRIPFNLWLNAGGRIKCDLSRFEAKSVKLNKVEAERLFRLQDKMPMELVLQRAQRDELLHVIHCGGWRVAPELVAAVTRAVTDYHGARAPLYPLPAIQRLGYLDEQDTIECKTDLRGVPAMTEAEAGVTPREAVIFHAGQKYSLRTQTVNVTRRSSKPNSFTGAPEELEHSGQQLAIYISDGLVNPAARENLLNEYCFMDATIKDDPHTKVAVAKKQKHNDADRVLIDFTLQQLAGRFVIPEVPDVAAANPDGYRKHLDTLAELERICEVLAG